jgi:hypothetical protein
MGSSKQSINYFILYDLGIPVTSLAISILLTFNKDSVGKSIAITLIITGLSTLLSQLAKELSNYYKDNIKSLTENTRNNENILVKITLIEEKVNKSIGIFAVNSDDNIFEKQLEILKTKEKGLKWIVARFIAKQLAFHFDKLSFEINSQDYSRFSKKLYAEVAESLYLTNSVTPYKWFNNLFTSNFDINSIEDKDIPAHITTWRHLDKTKKRLIILSENEINDLYKYDIYFDKYNEINKATDDNTRYIAYEELQRRVPEISTFAINKFDYAIFDNEIALKWELPTKNDEKTCVHLIDLVLGDQQVKRLVNDVFNEEWNNFMKVTELKDKIKKQKESING